METSSDIVIIGAGFAGIAAAWQLIAHGITDFVVLERGDEVGGTWRDNSYPGAACDIKSDLYSFSFAPNPDWSHAYSRQPEILDYLIGVSHRRGIREHLRFGVELQKAEWHEERGRWTLSTSAGELTTRVLWLGSGQLVDPHLPDIPGAASFGQVFHSARWDHSVDLAHKRVGVVGTGASAIQIVPALQPIVDELVVFQRTPPWIIPRHDKPTSALRRRLFRAVPALQRLMRGAIFAFDDARWFGFAHPRVGKAIEGIASHHLQKQVGDPRLRARLRPPYRIGCKRVLVSDDYYPALGEKNVALETEPISRIEPSAVVLADGSARDLDILIFATGFEATRPAIADRIVGRAGRTLADTWSTGMRALRGAAVPGFPNLYLLHGPNAALSHNSALYMIERQVEYALTALLSLPEDGVAECLPEALDRYEHWLQPALDRGVWSTGGCTSFYLDAENRNTVLWPKRAASFRRAAAFRPDEYRITTGPSSIAPSGQDGRVAA
jgi:cation diffusion facilitator CzcD-associated flavoprotein CzcO